MASTLAAPRYWPTWVGVAVMWLVARLPLGVQFALGRAIGAIGYRVAPARRHIATVNVQLCFPELDATARDALVRRIFTSTGIGAVETAMAWFGDVLRLRDRVTFEGLDVLTTAQQRGHGVVLIGAHFSTLDLAGALLSQAIDLDVIYRYNKNPVIEWAMRRGRERRFRNVIERSDTRAVLTQLKAGHTVWYAADQDYGRKVSVFAPFFGVPAATITATARFARFNASPAVFISHFRDATTRTWSFRFRELEGFPGNDDGEDAARINAVIESEIRRHPDQYLWLHRRFKTRPEGEPRPY
jgi:Kdo2-lipid IVA lauroyltransferase/acyltransferase